MNVLCRNRFAVLGFGSHGLDAAEWMYRTRNVAGVLCMCQVVAGCANLGPMGAAQSESRSVACNAACQQATSAAPVRCEECMCDRIASGPAVCTVRSVRN